MILDRARLTCCGFALLVLHVSIALAARRTTGKLPSCPVPTKQAELPNVPACAQVVTRCYIPQLFLSFLGSFLLEVPCPQELFCSTVIDFADLTSVLGFSCRRQAACLQFDCHTLIHDQPLNLSPVCVPLWASSLTALWMCMQLARVLEEDQCSSEGSKHCCGLLQALINARCHCWQGLADATRSAMLSLAVQCSLSAHQVG